MPINNVRTLLMSINNVYVKYYTNMLFSSSQIYEVIGVYFVNCYWNNLYNNAIDMIASDQYASLDDAYRASLQIYASAFTIEPNKNQTNKNYNRIINDIHMLFRKYKYNESIQEMINMIIQTCVSDNIRDTMDNVKKDEVLRKILIAVITKFTIHVQGDTERAVSAESRRKNAEIITSEWSKVFVEIFIQERNKLNSMLIAAKNNVKINNDSSLIEKNAKLQTALQKIIVEKAELTKQYNNVVKLFEKYKLQNTELTQKLAELEGRYKEASQKKSRNNFESFMKPIQPALNMETLQVNGIASNESNKINQNTTTLDEIIQQVEAPPGESDDDIMNEFNYVSTMVPDE